MARTWEHGSGARILRIDSAWSKEVERALENLRHAIQTGDLALEGLKRD